MAATFNVCVVAPTTLLGETLLEILEARAFPIGELHVAGRGDADEETTSYRVRITPSRIWINSISASATWSFSAVTVLCLKNMRRRLRRRAQW